MAKFSLVALTLLGLSTAVYADPPEELFAEDARGLATQVIPFLDDEDGVSKWKLVVKDEAAGFFFNEESLLAALRWPSVVISRLGFVSGDNIVTYGLSGSFSDDGQEELHRIRFQRWVAGEEEPRSHG